MEAVIFDFNGTLFWDTPKHIEAWCEYSRKLRGTPFTPEESVSVLGMTNKLVAEFCLGREITQEEAKKIAEEKEKMYMEMCLKDPSCFVLAPGAVELFEFLAEKGIPFAIATSSDKGNVDFFVKHLNLSKWFKPENIIYDDGTIRGKPNPDLYLNAIKRLNVDADKCIVFEDALNGVKAAQAAGVKTIFGITEPKYMDKVKSYPGIIDAYDDFNKFDRKYLAKAK